MYLTAIQPLLKGATSVGLLWAACLAVVVAATSVAAGPLSFSWRELPPLPAKQQAWSDAIPVKAPWWRQIGLAGLIVGVHRDVLLVGGDANFPEPGLTFARMNNLGKVYWDELVPRDLKANAWQANAQAVGGSAQAAEVNAPLPGFRGHARFDAFQPHDQADRFHSRRLDPRGCAHRAANRATRNCFYRPPLRGSWCPGAGVAHVRGLRARRGPSEAHLAWTQAPAEPRRDRAG